MVGFFIMIGQDKNLNFLHKKYSTQGLLQVGYKFKRVYNYGPPTPDGITPSNRVDTLSERKLHGMVVDNALNSTTLSARLMGMGRKFTGKTNDYTIKIKKGSNGQWITGAEDLSMQASDTTVTLSWAHAEFTQEIVIPMGDAFANAGPEGTIDLSLFKIDEAQADAINNVGPAAYSLGISPLPDGLEILDDDGTNSDNIGGQSRGTYGVLKSQVKHFTTLSFANLETIEDLTRAAGIDTERPNIHVTTKTNWSYFSQLHEPEVRADWATIGYNSLPIRGNTLMKTVDLKGGSGFTALTFRGKPVIDDDNCLNPNWYMLNERYVFWKGRTIVPPLFKQWVEKVNLGKPRTIEGVSAGSIMDMPSPNNGWFYQKLMISPSQAAAVARYWIFGNMFCSQPRRLGKNDSFTGI